MVTDQGVSPLEALAAGVVPSSALDRLLDAARAASPYERIGYRDPIAAHGKDAITAVTPWLSDRVLSAFAVRVILYAGVAGDHEAAVSVLRKGRPAVPWVVREDIDSAIRRLHEVMPYASRHTSAHTTTPHVPAGDPHPRPRRAPARATARAPLRKDDIG